MGVISNPIHFLNSPFAMMVMMVYYFLPFMILPIYASLDKFNYDLIEVSRDLGAGPFQTFFLVFIPAFGEFVIPELMGGDKYYFVGSVISQYVLGQTTGPLGAAFTVISSVALILCTCLCSWSLKRMADKLSRRSR